LYEVELDDGARLHAYLHSETRRYLHLDNGGRAVVLVCKEDREEDGAEQYEEVDPQWLLRLAIEGRGVIIVGQNLVAEWKSLSWARSATRHRISRQRASYVVKRSGLAIEEDPPASAPAGATARYVFLGDDEHGRPLEVMAIERQDGSLKVIHAMHLRQRYREDYEEIRNHVRTEQWPR